jgi:hypothetical protein
MDERITGTTAEAPVATIEEPPPDQPPDLPTLEMEGFSATVDAFAWEPDPDAAPPRMRLWCVSLLGPQQSVKALWARLVRGERATMRFEAPAAPGGLTRARFCALAPEGPRGWRLFTAALPASAGYHGLLVPQAALYACDQTSFILLPPEAETEDQVAALHYRFLNRRTSLPLHAAWAGWLWQRAVRANEATMLESRGTGAYRCMPDVAALATDLSAAVRRKELTLDVEPGRPGGGTD